MRQIRVKPLSIFRDLADAVDALGEQEVSALLREAIGRPTDSVVIKQPQIKQKGSVRVLGRSAVVMATKEHLQHANSREEGIRQIADAGLNRRELEALARSVDVPVRKDMRAEDLEELIVNMTVGGRLNSVAIRGTG